MASFPIEKKLVIAVSSSALFDLTQSHEVFDKLGPVEYKKFQEENLNTILNPGVAFPFVKRLLSLNERFASDLPVEVVLLSRNSAATGRRVFRSIERYGLEITRAAFTEGKSPYRYLPAFNSSLFLSAHEDDVRAAIGAGFAAGQVLPTNIEDDELDTELRIAFDFDGVIIDDESEAVFQSRSLSGFKSHEKQKLNIPHQPGPLAKLFKELSVVQKLEDLRANQQSDYKRILRTAIVTARGAPTHERVVTTLEHWGVSANETFFLGGMEKARVLNELKPHVFFDDQLGHLKNNGMNIPMVHIPFGIRNSKSD